MSKTKIKRNKISLRVNKELEDGLDPSILAKQVLIKGENRRVFIDYVVKIRERIGVHSKIEEEFFKTYIFSGWKLRRFREIEKNLLNNQQKFTGEELEESDSLNAFDGDIIKRRIRNLSKIKVNDEIKENNIMQEKQKKEMTKALRQLREEQKLG